MDRVFLVFRRRRGTGKVVNPIHATAKAERFNDIMHKKTIVLVRQQLGDVFLPSRFQIIDTDNMPSGIQQPSGQVGPYEPGSACQHNNACTLVHGNIVEFRIKLIAYLFHSNSPF